MKNCKNIIEQNTFNQFVDSNTVKYTKKNTCGKDDV